MSFSAISRIKAAAAEMQSNSLHNRDALSDSNERNFLPTEMLNATSRKPGKDTPASDCVQHGGDLR